MKQRLVFVVLFALVVSGAASAVLYRLISTQLAANKVASNSKIVVATHNLAGGDLIKEVDISLADWTGPVPPGTITKTEDAVNRGVIEPIYQGEPLMENRMAKPGAGAGLAPMIPQGMRAVAIRVNDVVAVSGFAAAGSHVDVLIAGNPPGANQALGTVTKTLLQNVEILSAGATIQKDAEGKPVSVPTVNLLLTPTQAEIMSLASNEARIQLVLRNPTDTEEAKPPGTAMAYLFNGGVRPPPKEPSAGTAPRQVLRAPPPPPPPAKVVVPPPPPPINVEVIHGSRKVEQKFAAEEND
ncbi:MAG: Flp pilus assembly protein CpaB, partial [Acidobacteriota bacterium]